MAGTNAGIGVARPACRRRRGSSRHRHRQGKIASTDGAPTRTADAPRICGEPSSMSDQFSIVSLRARRRGGMTASRSSHDHFLIATGGDAIRHSCGERLGLWPDAARPRSSVAMVLVPAEGFEPPATRLRSGCSTAELRRPGARSLVSAREQLGKQAGSAMPPGSMLREIAPRARSDRPSAREEARRARGPRDITETYAGCAATGRATRIVVPPPDPRPAPGPVPDRRGRAAGA